MKNFKNKIFLFFSFFFIFWNFYLICTPETHPTQCTTRVPFECIQPEVNRMINSWDLTVTNLWDLTVTRPCDMNLTNIWQNTDRTWCRPWYSPWCHYGESDMICGHYYDCLATLDPSYVRYHRFIAPRHRYHATPPARSGHPRITHANL